MYSEAAAVLPYVPLSRMHAIPFRRLEYTKMQTSSCAANFVLAGKYLMLPGMRITACS